MIKGFVEETYLNRFEAGLLSSGKYVLPICHVLSFGGVRPMLLNALRPHVKQQVRIE